MVTTIGGPFNFNPDKDIVLGHEFCGEIVELGESVSEDLRIGDRVVSQPVVFGPDGFAVLGYSNEYGRVWRVFDVERTTGSKSS